MKKEDKMQILEAKQQDIITEGWGRMPTYTDYHEPTEAEIQLEEVKNNLKEFYEDMQQPDAEFEKTFKKRFKDILA